MKHRQITLDGTQIPISEFSMDMMVDNPSICMIAKRGSGKSEVVKQILRSFKYLPGGVIISKTDRMSKFYGKFFPESFIYYTYTSKIIEKILTRQAKMIQKAKEYYKLGKKCDPRFFIVMDDCLSSKGSWMKDELIMEIFFNGRHYGVMYILTMQFPLGIKPELRGNFDYIFILAEDFVSNQKRLFEHYAGMFPDFPSFREVFKELTKDYGSMVIVNRGAKETFFEKVYWYKADISKIIRSGDIGHRQFNTFHEKNYNQNWNKDEKSVAIEDFAAKRKSGTKIGVQRMNHE